MASALSVIYGFEQFLRLPEIRHSVIVVPCPSKNNPGQQFRLTHAVFIIYLAGLTLSRQGDFTKTFRAVGFAQSVYLIAILAFFPPLAPVIRLFMLVLGFLATWLAAATAHKTSGWRTLLLPVVAYLVLIVGTVIVAILLAGAKFTLQGVLYSLGIQPPSP